MRRFLCGVALALVSFVAKADCSGNGCSDVYVDRLYLTSAGTVYVGTSGDETKLSCAAEGGVYVSLILADPAGKIMYATLLAAQATNRPVFLRTESNSVGCRVLYMTLDREVAQ